MPRVPGLKALPWTRVLFALQIVVSGFQELEAHERKLAREIAGRAYRNRRLSERDRQHLMKLARKAGKGAAKGARGRGAGRLRGPR
jgi:hypothetical protein